MCRKTILLIFLVLFMSLGGKASAIDYYKWIGGGATDIWSDPNNWDVFAVPDGTEVITYLDKDNAHILIDPSVVAVCNNIRMAYYYTDVTLDITGGSLTTYGYIRVAYNANNAGTINVSGNGVLTDHSYIRMSYKGGAYSELNISDNGIVNVDSYVRAGYATDGNTVINISGNGTLNVGDYLRIGHAGTATLNVNGGTVNVENELVVPNLSDGLGDVNLVDGTIRAGELSMIEGRGSIDISSFGSAKIVLDGDVRNPVKTWVDAGMITGDGTPRLVSVVLDNDGNTAVAADPAADLSVAYKPSPVRDATNVPGDVLLTWSPGVGATQHDVYVGTSFDDVNDATTSSTGIYKTTLPAASNSYDPALELGKTYYWRVDEVGGSVAKGEVWRFDVSSLAVVDDFEQYNTVDNMIYDTWKDYHDDENNGAAITLVEDAEFAYGGDKCMQFTYDNDWYSYSETQMTLAVAEDWTAHFNEYK